MPPLSTAGNNAKPSEPTEELGKSKQTGVLFEDDVETVDGALATDVTPFMTAEKRQYDLVWRNVIIFGYLHLAAFYGAYLCLSKAKWATVFFAIFLYIISILGITAGVHRLWTHRAYKAKWPLRVILIIFNTIAFQDPVYHWVRDHRVHHKFSDTDADPFNPSRGLFFSHIGWLFCKKHPDVVAKGKTIDLSDLKADPIVMFQRKYYMIMMPIACFILPTVIPMYFWNETFINSWFVATMLRWCFSLNITWSVASVAHKFGVRPYDKTILPAQNPGVTFFTLGEGWHNYHHVFPWDYRAAELGNSMNMTTYFIDFFAKIGWAYDMKTVAPETIEKRTRRTGDGSHEIWGYGDKDATAEDYESMITLNKEKTK